jgi:BMFP domain-containing protein YqiC
MKERGRFMDDLAGVAQGAFSAFSGLRDEAEAVFTARVEAVIQKLDIARGEQLAAVQELAANARAGQEAAETKLDLLTLRVEALEAKLAGGSAPATGAPIVDPLTAFPSDVPPTEPTGLPSDPPHDGQSGLPPVA